MQSENDHLKRTLHRTKLTPLKQSNIQNQQQNLPYGLKTLNFNSKYDNSNMNMPAQDYIQESHQPQENQMNTEQRFPSNLKLNQNFKGKNKNIANGEVGLTVDRDHQIDDKSNINEYQISLDTIFSQKVTNRYFLENLKTGKFIKIQKTYMDKMINEQNRKLAQKDEEQQMVGDNLEDQLEQTKKSILSFIMWLCQWVQGILFGCSLMLIFSIKKLIKDNTADEKNNGYILFINQLLYGISYIPVVTYGLLFLILMSNNGKKLEKIKYGIIFCIYYASFLCTIIAFCFSSWIYTSLDLDNRDNLLQIMIIIITIFTGIGYTASVKINELTINLILNAEDENVNPFIEEEEETGEIISVDES